MVKRAFKIKEVRPGIFLFDFKNNYDLCMHFMRYQEYYESSSSKYRGKKFEIFEFMRWYSFKFGKGIFTYTDDWNGFNLPGNIINDVWKLHISDKNIYDYEMLHAWNECNRRADGKPFYIIGTAGKEALDHEIAHGLFYLNPEYQKKMKSLVRALSPEIRKEMNSSLKHLGYTPKVYVDETQAYMATGLPESFENPDQWLDEQNPFHTTFVQYSRKKK
jgi:hypothetical protein